MGNWLIEHGDLLLALGGTALGLLGSVLSLWLRYNLQPLSFRIEQLTRELVQVHLELKDLWSHVGEVETFKNGLRLPDCLSQRERFESDLRALETRQQLALTGEHTAIELALTRQIAQVAEENRRFREELGRQIQNDTRDFSRTLITEDAVHNAIHSALQTLREKELANMFERLRELERGKHR